MSNKFFNVIKKNKIKPINFTAALIVWDHQQKIIDDLRKELADAKGDAGWDLEASLHNQEVAQYQKNNW